MNLRKVKIIYSKEILDTLRDRRTLVSSVLIPIILFPILMFGINAVVVTMFKKTKAETTRITVMGEEFAPRFVSDIFRGRRRITDRP
jgi:sodium transport system permease protein